MGVLIQYVVNFVSYNIIWSKYKYVSEIKIDLIMVNKS